MLRIFPGYAEEPKILSLITELSLASSANSIGTNVEFRTVGSRSGSRNQQPRQFYLRQNIANLAGVVNFLPHPSPPRTRGSGVRNSQMI